MIRPRTAAFLVIVGAWLMLATGPAGAGDMTDVRIGGAVVRRVWESSCPMPLPPLEAFDPSSEYHDLAVDMHRRALVKRGECVVDDATVDIAAGRFPLRDVLAGVLDDGRRHSWRGHE